ncbi:lytic transglycosylase domain-containing protein [Pseudohoeflea suaedae]|uniref:Lytic transglycosylase domain-containing protein n=2 Tax=Pseudohoeflea suaedae TaxID=877384 RepID=A0A4R5PJ32_9HYPH|nr:lytic transglycosylase domain-containing protein [Pseudohoeflea suaedae]
MLPCARAEGAEPVLASVAPHTASTQVAPPRTAAGPADCGAVKAQELASRDDYEAYAGCMAEEMGLPRHFATAVMEIESGFNPHARGRDGEIGLMQILPATASMLGFGGDTEELAVPATNIRYGLRYLAGAYRLGSGDLCTTVMKYRAGHRETRFSVLSVRYCERARDIFRRDGHEVSGPLPVATFGFSAAAGSNRRGTACLRRSFVPGPGYGRCLAAAQGAAGQRSVAQRRALFE